ncbi:MAG: methionine adenosyltransferase [Planctomycetia bacterium]|nr:methionine adenosyltransferase [Planctomycetia bacterium]
MPHNLGSLGRQVCRPPFSLQHEAPVVAQGKYLFTSESVSMGHPDKLADQISDGVLDAYLAQDPHSRVACETMVTTGLAVIAGEITSKGTIDYQQVVRDVIREVGYTDAEMGIAADTCSVLVAVGKQSADIAMGVNEDATTGKDVGAGDQGLMFGYACNETPEFMPLPIALSHRILDRLTDARKKKEVDWLRPDSKSQVTVEYEGDKPVRIDTVVVSTQHAPHVSNEDIRKFVIEKIVKPLLPKDLDTSDITYHINPTGRFVVGGPHGDCGLTGRKIIVDTYGGWGRHGGGAFSGKDPTKVVSVHVDTEGTGKVEDERLCEVVRDVFPLTPRGIIDYLDLRRPIFRRTAAGGHFGRDEFPWEKTDKAKQLAQAARAAGAVA